MKLITFGKKNQPGETGKPYLKGNAADGQTLRESLRFFGVMLLVFFISFISCSSISAAGAVLRIAFSVAVILLVIFILFNNGLNKGADAVARGEILYQREQKGEPFTDAERKCSFHPAKGFVTGLIGSIPYSRSTACLRHAGSDDGSRNASDLDEVICRTGRHRERADQLHAARRNDIHQLYPAYGKDLYPAVCQPCRL